MSPLRRVLASLSFLAGLVTAAAQVQAADNEIIVFMDANGAGISVTFTSDVYNLGGTGYNDKISSVLVVKGSWELCNDSGFKGGCVTVSAGSGVVNMDSLNDKVSSLRTVAVVAPPAEEGDGAAVLFFDQEGAGTAIRVTGDIANFNSISANDKISSIAVFSGQWQVCKNTNYSGGCTTLEPGMTYNLVNYDNKISSMRLVNTP